MYTCGRGPLTGKPPAPILLRRLAAELLRLRTAAGLTREQVAEQTGINAVSLYRIETARVRPQRRSLILLLDLYRVEEPQRTTLLFPGLLQTEAYTRAVFAAAAPPHEPAWIEQAVRVRGARKRLLTKRDPLRLCAVVDEAALHRLVGGTEVMSEQLRHLVVAMRQPHIAVQVIPFGAGAHAAMSDSFNLIEFPVAADPRVVYIEGSTGADTCVEDEAEVAQRGTIFERLRESALSRGESASMIAAMADRLSEYGK